MSKVASNGDVIDADTGEIVREETATTLESVIARGDLSKLSAAQRTEYYVKVCQTLGLNHLTKPFEYMVLNGKLTLYARKDCTDQLRKIHQISVLELLESDRDGVYVVTAKVQDRTGRTDVAKGAVALGNLKGEALANALMKAETKAKRRATLSITGLGMLDETEVEDIPSKPASAPNGSLSLAQVSRIIGDLQHAGASIEEMLRWVRKTYPDVKAIGDIPASEYDAILAGIERVAASRKAAEVNSE